MAMHLWSNAPSEGSRKIGQKLQTTKTVILAVGPEAKKTVKLACKEAFDENLDVSFSARDLGVDATLGGPKRKGHQNHVFAGGSLQESQAGWRPAHRRRNVGAELTNAPGYLRKRVRTAVARAISGKALSSR
eukprot:9975924-Heterocapsa_arctica.AAC.1